MGAVQSGPPSNAAAAESGLSGKIIRDQLATVLGSPEFAKRAVLRKFLSFVVEKYLAGQSHMIKEYTVATEVSGRRESFDSLSDSIVRMQAGRLRRALERYYFSSGAHDPVRIEIPKGSYVPVFHKISTAGPGNERFEPELGRPARSPACEPSVAVMPLVNLTADPGQEYFTDGMTEELTQELARFQHLRVIASYSTLQRKEDKASASEIAQRLGARFLLEGCVRKEDKTVKVSIRLHDTVSGMQVWGEQYRRELMAQRLMALQEDIARSVAGRVGDAFGVISAQLSRESRKKHPKSMNTYEAFLRYHHYHTCFSAESFTAAFKALEDAVAEEPESGLAWSMLANLHTNSCLLGYSQADTTLEVAMAMARKGVSLDPRNQLSHHILAYILFICNERDAFIREAEEAVSLNPNNPATIGFMGWMKALYGDWESGIALLARATQLNPHFPGYYHIAPYFDHYRRAMYPEALREARQIHMPQLFWDPLLVTAALGQMGMEARTELERLLALRPDFSTSGSCLISMLVKSPSLVEATLDGLRKAGLKI
jgi:adenylate cyclase